MGSDYFLRCSAAGWYLDARQSIWGSSLSIGPGFSGQYGRFQFWGICPYSRTIHCDNSLVVPFLSVYLSWTCNRFGSVTHTWRTQANRSTILNTRNNDQETNLHRLAVIYGCITARLPGVYILLGGNVGPDQRRFWRDLVAYTPLAQLPSEQAF